MVVQAGFINDDHLEIGTLAAPGMALIDIVNTQPLKLKVNVSESEIAQIAVGDEVTVKAGVFPDKEFEGKASFTANKDDASLRYEVEINLEGVTEDIKPGMYGYVTFNYDRQDAILINRRALISGLKKPVIYYVFDRRLFKLGKDKKEPILLEETPLEKMESEVAEYV